VLAMSGDVALVLPANILACEKRHARSRSSILSARRTATDPLHKCIAPIRYWME
jgi:hypothetical protein